MTKEIPMTKPENILENRTTGLNANTSDLFRHWLIRHSLVIGHSCFVILSSFVIRH